MNYLFGGSLIALAIVAWLLQGQMQRAASAEAVSAGLSQSVKRLEGAREADSRVVAQAAEQSDRMATAARNAEYKLQEAMRGQVDFDRVLSRDVTDALCLRYLNAAGQGDRADAAGRADAGAGDTVAERGAPPAGGTGATRCDGWAGMTVRGAVEWAGLLVDHAGMEKLDKAAIRQWSEEAKVMGKSE